MKKSNLFPQTICLLFALCVFILSGCSKENEHFEKQTPTQMNTAGEITHAEEPPAGEAAQLTQENTSELQETTEVADEAVQPEDTIPAEDQETPETLAEPVIKELDLSDYFDGIGGAAVLYDPTDQCHLIYNQELALTRRSPCSTFKIISSLIALENGIIVPNDSTRTWSGELFWNEEWNTDIDFTDAFHASCVWYFREVIDEIGQDMMQTELNNLQYGNCDISDWAGRLNTNNSNPVLTGFWIESSLLISPKEQTEVMERIFGGHAAYSEETLTRLKQVMLLPETAETAISVYGKTGMGKAYGIVVDAWFTGFADAADKRIYFCVYLGETADQNVSSTRAKEIAVKIVTDYLSAS